MLPEKVLDTLCLNGALQAGWMGHGRGRPTRSSRQGWERDWTPAQGGREGGLWGRDSMRWGISRGAGLAGGGLRGGPVWGKVVPGRTLAGLSSRERPWGLRRDAVPGGLGRRTLEILDGGVLEPWALPEPKLDGKSAVGGP